MPPDDSLQIQNVVADLPQGPDQMYRKKSPKLVVIHHSATGRSSHWCMVKSIANWHVRGKRFPRIAYHYLVMTDGTVYQVSDHDQITYHAGNYVVNKESLGVCLIGDFTRYDPTPEQIESSRKLLAMLNLPVKAHREIVPTQCPGDTTREWWSALTEGFRE